MERIFFKLINRSRSKTFKKIINIHGSPSPTKYRINCFSVEEILSWFSLMSPIWRSRFHDQVLPNVSKRWTIDVNCYLCHSVEYLQHININICHSVEYLQLLGYVLVQNWLDFRLNWTSGRSQDFSSITYMYATEKYIWTPTLYVENSYVSHQARKTWSFMYSCEFM